MRKKKMIIMIFIIYILCLLGSVFCHSGRTDKNGGHYRFIIYKI